MTTKLPRKTTIKITPGDKEQKKADDFASSTRGQVGRQIKRAQNVPANVKHNLNTVKKNKLSSKVAAANAAKKKDIGTSRGSGPSTTRKRGF